MAATKWGLILGGGTALGAVQVTVAERLFADLGPPSGIAGVSVGAVNALLLGEHRVADLRAAWEGIDGIGDFAAPQVDIWNGIRSLRPLRRIMAERRAGMTLRTPTWAGLVDVSTRCYQSIALHHLQDVGHRWDAAVGSASQPLIMEPAHFRGRLVMDGGAGGHVLPPLPNWAEMDEIHIVSCSPVGDRRRTTAPPPVSRSDVLHAASAAWALLLGRQADEDLEDLRDQYAGVVPTYLYAPKSWAEVGDPFEAEREDIEQRFATGLAMVEGRERLSRTAPMRRPR